MEIGIQFYTLRDFCKDLDSFSETLKKVADIGYKNVQISGTCEFRPEWLKKELDKNGLKCVITHTAAPRLINETEKVAKEHDIFGCDYIGLSYYSFDSEKNDQSLEYYLKTYSNVADELAKNGKYFMHHNHDYEFKRYNGKIMLEYLEDNFAPDKLGIILDTFWVQAGGADPAYWLERLSGRVPCIHLKDYAFGKQMAVLGEGNINFDRVFKAAEAAGTKYMLVEQDDCNGENPFNCIKRSYDYLKSRGF